MDPNAALAELRRRVAATLESPAHSSLGDAERIAELFAALDSWISTGGFLPREWQRPGAVIGTTSTPMRSDSYSVQRTTTKKETP